MRDHTEFHGVLERLLSALIEHPRELVVDSSPLPNRRNWTFICEASDVGKIIGAGGTRLRRIRLLTEIAGRLGDEYWWLDWPAKPTGQQQFGKRRMEIPESHNPANDLELLRDVLKQLGVNAEVAVSGDVDKGFRFSISPSQIQDDMALLDSHEAIYAQTQRETIPLNAKAAIRDLWKAIGLASGVRYIIPTGSGE